MYNYRILSKKGEGTFSEVMRALSLRGNKHVALKCMKGKFKTAEQVKNLFEIQALRVLSGHPHIVHLQEVLFDGGRLAMVFELMDMNLYEYIKDREQFLSESQVVDWMYQLFQAINYMHENDWFHRDIKPENLLLIGDTLKVADLGSCCPISAQRQPPYTEYISTRWYRSPECLLTSGYYNYKMDIWSSGCVFYELVALEPLFKGRNELDQICQIHTIMGTPSEEVLGNFQNHRRGDYLKNILFQPAKGTGFCRKLGHCSDLVISFLTDVIVYDHRQRPDACTALEHALFAQRTPTPIVLESHPPVRREEHRASPRGCLPPQLPLLHISKNIAHKPCFATSSSRHAKITSLTHRTKSNDAQTNTKQQSFGAKLLNSARLRYLSKPHRTDKAQPIPITHR